MMAGWNAEFLGSEEVAALGLGAVGHHVLIHRTAVLVNTAAIFLGDHIRIDPFVLISASEQVRIGRNVHIAAYVSIVGAARIELDDFVGLSQGVRLLSSTDDFSGAHMTGPTIPERYKAIQSAPLRNRPPCGRGRWQRHSAGMQHRRGHHRRCSLLGQ